MVEHLSVRPTLHVGESRSAILYWGVWVGWGHRATVNGGGVGFALFMSRLQRFLALAYLGNKLLRCLVSYVLLE